MAKRRRELTTGSADWYGGEKGYSAEDDAGDDRPGRLARLRRWVRMTTGIVLVLVTLGVLLVIVITARRIAKEPNPASEFAATLAAGGEPDFTEGLDWPAHVQAAAHTLPAMIKNELAAPGEQHGYEFQGRAGQTWAITVEPQSGSSLDPVVSVYAPLGREMASNDDRAEGDWTAELVIVLPQDGPYRLLVEAAEGGVSTGRYLLQVWER